MRTLQEKQSLIFKQDISCLYIFFILFLFVIGLMSACEAQAANKTTSPEYLSLTFKELKSFSYVDPDIEDVKKGTHPKQIPTNIMALNKKKVSLKGFMVPLELDKRGIISFILVSNQMECCFGLPEQMNGWVIVALEPNKRSSYYQDVLIDVQGVLEVGEKVDKDGNMSLYRINAHSVKPPKKGNFVTFW